jgi:hypothetical protein
MVLQTHYESDVIRRELAKMAEELTGDFDIWVTGYCETSERACELEALASSSVRVAPADPVSLRGLPYPAKLAAMNWEDSRGNNDLALLKFFRDHSDYDEYWFVEYDVRCLGTWSDIIDGLANSDADLICTHLLPYSPADDWWPHWKSLQYGAAEVKSTDRLRGFLPLCRVSKSGLETIDEFYQNGWAGHPEAVWPTALRVAGKSVEELGGQGPLTPPDRQGKFYHSARLPDDFMFTTFGVFPTYFDAELYQGKRFDGTTLWHPVKEISPISS